MTLGQIFFGSSSALCASSEVLRPVTLQCDVVGGMPGSCGALAGITPSAFLVWQTHLYML